MTNARLGTDLDGWTQKRLILHILTLHLSSIPFAKGCLLTWMDPQNDSFELPATLMVSHNSFVTSQSLEELKIMNFLSKQHMVFQSRCGTILICHIHYPYPPKKPNKKVSVFVATSPKPYKETAMSHFPTPSEVAGIIDPNGNQLMPGVCQGEGFFGLPFFFVKLARDRKHDRKPLN